MTKEDEQRINFSSDVKSAIAARVNYQCSIPRCKLPASAPNIQDNNSSINMGTACHIYAAKTKGPRGQGDKTPEFIASVDNGIWCCNYHGSRIDKFKGKEFSPETLFMWKKLAEAKVSKASSGYNYPFGWINNIQISQTNLPVFEKNLPTINLSKNTILHSPQEAGQSTLLEFISCINDDKYIKRWKDGNTQVELVGIIEYDTIDNQVQYTLQLNKDGLSKYKNEVHQVLPPNDVEIIYVDLHEYNNEEDIVDFFLKILKVDLTTFNLILKEASIKDSLFKGNYQVVQKYIDDDGNTCIKTKKDGSYCFTIEISHSRNNEEYCLEYESFSGSEKSRILLSLLISKVRIISREKPVLLMLGSRALGLDCPMLTLFLKTLRKMEIQTIIEAPWRYEKIFNWSKTSQSLDLDNWKGYENPEQLINFYNELEHWEIKDIFEDSSR